MFNLIARRTIRNRVRATLKPHRRSTKSLGVLGIRGLKGRILPRQPNAPHRRPFRGALRQVAAGRGRGPWMLWWMLSAIGLWLRRLRVQALSPRPVPHAAAAGALPDRATTRSRSAGGLPPATGAPAVPDRLREEALHETFTRVDLQVNDARSRPPGVRGPAGVGSASSPEHMREVLSGANPKLVVGIGEVILHGLRRDEQGLCDLAIRPSVRRQMGNPILGRRERFDAVGHVATRSRASRLQLIATPLEEGKRAAAVGEIHPATQYHAGLADAPMPAKRRTEGDQGTSQFQPGR